MNKAHYSTAMLSLAALLACVVPFGASAEDADRQDFVVFGDSLSDTGNRFFDAGAMNTPPYELVAAEGLIPSLPYAFGSPTYSNGRIYIEHVVTARGHGGGAQAALRSSGIAANYAYAGARASNAAPLPPNSNRNLGDQVVQYLADSGADGVSPDAIHLLFIGGNDIATGIVLAAQGVDPTPVVQNAVGEVFNNAFALATAGARRFLIVTIPNPGYIPAFGGNPGAIFGGAQLTTVYNCALVGTGPTRPFCPPQPVGVPTVSEALAGLFGAEVIVFEGQALFDDIVANPGNYGLSNTSTPCIRPFQPPFHCEDSDEYVYWDNIHPSARVHAILGDAVIAALSD